MILVHVYSIHMMYNIILPCDNEDDRETNVLRQTPTSIVATMSTFWAPLVNLLFSLIFWKSGWKTDACVSRDNSRLMIRKDDFG